MDALRTYSVAILILLVMLLLTTVYTVREGQHGILLRLGKIVSDSSGKPAVKGPGLHFKFPFINTIRIFDTRIQTLDIESSRIVTANKKDVLVDYFVKWRINDLPLYFTRTEGNILQAETLLAQKLNDGLRAEFGKRTIKEVVSGKSEDDGVGRGGRSEIMALLRKQSKQSAKDLGINVIDVRIKRIDLPTEVSRSVYERMRAERERVATEHRAEGKSKGEAIRAEADAKVTVILATAKSEAERIRGDGYAQAAHIYANAYGKHQEFFAFYRSVNAYMRAFNSNKDVVILKPDSQFFKYFNKANSKTT